MEQSVIPISSPRHFLVNVILMLLKTLWYISPYLLEVLVNVFSIFVQRTLFKYLQAVVTSSLFYYCKMLSWRDENQSLSLTTRSHYAVTCSRILTRLSRNLTSSTALPRGRLR